MASLPPVAPHGRRFAVAVLLGASLLAAPRLAGAFCRTTTTPVPPTYSPTRGCFEDGLPLFWKNACISYSINGEGASRIPYEQAAEVIDASFATWTAVTCASGGPVGITLSSRSPVVADRVQYNQKGPNQNLVVFRESSWPYSDPNNTLGLTTVTMDVETGEIYDADLEINATGDNLTAGDPVPSNGYDLASVVTHEAGHFLGLAHATDSRATMYASYKAGTTALRSLTRDDVAGVCEIYPSAAERAVDSSVSSSGLVAADACNDEPRHGFGATNEVNAASSDPPDGCAVGSAPRGSPATSTALAAALTLAGVVAARRGRRRARPSQM